MVNLPSLEGLQNHPWNFHKKRLCFAGNKDLEASIFSTKANSGNDLVRGFLVEDREHVLEMNYSNLIVDDDKL